jgi:glucose/arabinose dehydrogenase
MDSGYRARVNQITHTTALFLATLCPTLAAIKAVKVADGFERPIWMGVPKGIAGKIWVAEQGGKVWIVDLQNGKTASEPFLDVSEDITRKGNEEGLLGLAFAPDFITSGRYYINYTDKEKQTRIVRFTSENGQHTDHATEEILMKYPSEFENHNGGWLAFGPDDKLYIGNGDGGSGNDPNNRSQALDSLLGKILRIDVNPKYGYVSPVDNPFVDHPTAKPEIWAYGVRNPWRCSFDRETGDFWIGDVGQNHQEEINYIPKAKAAGANFGWRLREADTPNPKSGIGGPKPKDAIDPIYTYKHGTGQIEGLSVTGGYVYRGPIKELQGRYIFGDYQNPRIWSFVIKDQKPTDFKDHTTELGPLNGQLNLISSFAEDNDGHLYIIDHSGPIYKITNR